MFVTPKFSFVCKTFTLDDLLLMAVVSVRPCTLDDLLPSEFVFKIRTFDNLLQSESVCNTLYTLFFYRVRVLTKDTLWLHSTITYGASRSRTSVQQQGWVPSSVSISYMFFLLICNVCIHVGTCRCIQKLN